jgi:predicted Zn-dependent peptidase
MRSLAVTAENFENQRQAVKEERRLRLDNQPYTWVFFEAPHLTYDSTTCFSYAHSIIGSMDDLDAAQVADVQEFFDLHYAPNNATLTIVGDFDPPEAKQLVEQYFGSIPRGNDTAPVRCEWGIGTAADQIEREDPHATLPMVAVTYRIPGHSDADTPALQILDLIVGTGESSRLNRALVREQQSALQAQSFVLPRRSASTFMLMAVANQGADPATIKDQLDAVVTRILEEGVSEEELDKAKNAYRSGDIFGRQTTMQVAENIQHYARYHDSLDEIHTDLDAYMAVTRSDVQRVARKYLIPENSFTINDVPPFTSQPAVP